MKHNVHENLRIAVMGAGSLGIILCAYVAQNGLNVVLIDAYKEHIDALNRDGATVTGQVELSTPVHAILPEQMEGIYDIIIFMAKQTFNDVTIP